MQVLGLVENSSSSSQYWDSFSDQQGYECWVFLQEQYESSVALERFSRMSFRKRNHIIKTMPKASIESPCIGRHITIRSWSPVIFRRDHG
ncbi:uncharacterized protein LOC135005571 isoform X2 [Pseudophryne corroboree]|uniref:uncharacterized protein LOC134989975 isoform X2 n=1 Tax=Pseudophryne corroboree TaxID=495146 RepID=UPI0030813BCB